MKNMSSGRVLSEDDTFEVLRRIPFDQVQDKLAEFSTWFEQYREMHYIDTAQADRLKFQNKLRRMIGIREKLVYPTKQSPIFDEDITERLKGTGWTIESYAEVVDKPILEKRAEIRAIRTERRIYLLCAYLLVFAMGIQITVAVGVVWTQGLLLGLQLSSVVTALYGFVADKYLPYPSYSYRYE